MIFNSRKKHTAKNSIKIWRWWYDMRNTVFLVDFEYGMDLWRDKMCVYNTHVTLIGVRVFHPFELAKVEDFKSSVVWVKFNNIDLLKTRWKLCCDWLNQIQLYAKHRKGKSQILSTLKETKTLNFKTLKWTIEFSLHTVCARARKSNQMNTVKRNTIFNKRMMKSTEHRFLDDNHSSKPRKDHSHCA